MAERFEGPEEFNRDPELGPLRPGSNLDNLDLETARMQAGAGMPWGLIGVLVAFIGVSTAACWRLLVKLRPSRPRE